jgi:NADH-quinone oxidoreductase subunit K
MTPLSHYLILSAILFSIGTAGVFMRRNLITILLSIEIMLNAVNLTFVAFSRQAGTVDGQIIVALFRLRPSLNPDAFTSLKW